MSIHTHINYILHYLELFNKTKINKNFSKVYIGTPTTAVTLHYLDLDEVRVPDLKDYAMQIFPGEVCPVS